MTKRLFFAIPLLAASFAYGQSEEKAIRSMVSRQTSAANAADVAGYMATVDPKSPGYGQTKSAMEAVFHTYKLKFKSESIKILSIKGTTAQVQMVTLTTRISGPKFRDNRVKMTANLIKRSGKWLMSTAKVDKFDYLN